MYIYIHVYTLYVSGYCLCLSLTVELVFPAGVALAATPADDVLPDKANGSDENGSCPLKGSVKQPHVRGEDGRGREV